MALHGRDTRDSSQGRYCAQLDDHSNIIDTFHFTIEELKMFLQCLFLVKVLHLDRPIVFTTLFAAMPIIA